VSNLVYWSMIVAFFVPPVVAVINQSHWVKEVKAALFFVVALLAAGGTAYFQGDLTGRRWLESALIIVAGAAAYYHGLFKPTGVTDSIETATDVNRQQMPPA
jgi:hypothetical protein